MLTYWETLIAARSNITVSDSYAQLWGRKLSNAYTVATYSGTLPTTLQTVEGYLESYKIYGDSVQDGTPTPENPIVPSGCGERVDITGLNEPLCGIGTYTDSLELSTGILTRRIKKLALTGKENYIKDGAPAGYLYYFYATHMYHTNCLCSHLVSITGYPTQNVACSAYNNALIIHINFGSDVMNAQPSGNTVAGLKEYLAAQYANGTPVTVWYVLAEPEVSTVTVPSGLTGTIDGYLIQDGTPAPETPIYPTANGVKQADGTYSIPYGYKLPLTANGVEYPIYLGEVETTRRIKKYEIKIIHVLLLSNGNTAGISEYFSAYVVPGRNNTICDRALYGNMSEVGHFYVNKVNAVFIGSPTDTLDDFKSKYDGANLWCVLAEPETAVVNEPLMKIGDYADTIDSTQTSVQIPTAAGETTISWAGEGLAPSEVEFVYKVKR